MAVLQSYQTDQQVFDPVGNQKLVTRGGIAEFFLHLVAFFGESFEQTGWNVDLAERHLSGPAEQFMQDAGPAEFGHLPGKRIMADIDIEQPEIAAFRIPVELIRLNGKKVARAEIDLMGLSIPVAALMDAAAAHDEYHFIKIVVVRGNFPGMRGRSDEKQYPGILDPAAPLVMFGDQTFPVVSGFRELQHFLISVYMR